MPDLTHDQTEDGFHEIQLSGKQLVFLFMATTVVSVVIFLCGVLVGRSVRTDRESIADSTTTAALPDAGLDGGGPPASGEPPAAIGEFDPSYPERLVNPRPGEQLKEPTPEPPAAVEEKPAPTPVPAAAPAEAAGEVPTAGRPGTWFLQVSALRNREAAAATVRRLAAKGYPAYLENPARGTPPIYRVRIGRYRSRDEAEQVARRLQKEEQFSSDIRR